MSKILLKPFDSAKKIFRSIFLGSPNLITSSDLNRQLEALKYQMDYLDDKTGIITDIEVSDSLESTTLTVSWTKGMILFKGASFSFVAGTATSSFTSAQTDNFLYLHLVAESQLVTYDDDFSHEISGAKFEDGTSQPAANQLRYIDERLVISNEVNLQNSLGVIQKWELIESKELRKFPYYVPPKNGLFESRKIIGRYPKNHLPITIGDSYDMAFSKLVNEISRKALYKLHTASSFTFTTSESGERSCKVLFGNLPILDETSAIRLSGKCSVRKIGTSSSTYSAFNTGIFSLDSELSSAGIFSLGFSDTLVDSVHTFEKAISLCNFNKTEKAAYFAIQTEHEFANFPECYLEVFDRA